jgi:hypothetical protein
MSEGNSTTLADFLRTGQLGPVELGISAKGVADHFGLPDDIDDLSDLNEDMGNLEDHPYGTMVNYGALHLAFIDGELWYFIVDVNDGAGDLPDALNVTWLDDLRAMDRAAFAAALAEHRLVAHVVSADASNLRLVLPAAAVLVLFDLADGKDEILTLHRSVPIAEAHDLPLWEFTA